jgi:hypothetical protein
VEGRALLDEVCHSGRVFEGCILALTPSVTPLYFLATAGELLYSTHPSAMTFCFTTTQKQWS